ncbi:MAG: damage-inducible protein D [Gammaproteobacteria bacterium]|nr:MAG: damage-inducible protein D [Gammaproteobacteria bacterium]
MKETEIFHFLEDKPNFNDLCRQNGFTYWLASDFMGMLGYDKFHLFKKAIDKAIATCMTLELPIPENFEQILVDGTVSDYKLSRFACYLVAMNADVRKHEVAAAQAFFAATAEAIRRYIDSPEEVERVLIRKEISEHEKTLSGTASSAGVTEYALFQNAGYRGMYNMNLRELKGYKGLQKTSRSLLDFMGKDELAANLFRLTQTELKIKNDGITGQKPAENAAYHVGKEVRDTMIRISGSAPEDMALEEDIKKVKTSLKQTHKGLKKLDD